MNPDLWPRHFSFSSDGNYIYLVEQLLNKLQIWKIADNGTLGLKSETASENAPSFVTEL